VIAGNRNDGWNLLDVDAVVVVKRRTEASELLELERLRRRFQREGVDIDRGPLMAISGGDNKAAHASDAYRL
jgi:hypothetical protein